MLRNLVHIESTVKILRNATLSREELKEGEVGNTQKKRTNASYITTNAQKLQQRKRTETVSM